MPPKFVITSKDHPCTHVADNRFKEKDEKISLLKAQLAFEIERTEKERRLLEEYLADSASCIQTAFDEVEQRELEG